MSIRKCERKIKVRWNYPLKTRAHASIITLTIYLARVYRDDNDELWLQCRFHTPILLGLFIRSSRIACFRSRDHQRMAPLSQLSSASKHAESFRAREKRYSFCAGCPVAIGELERRHNTDTEVIDRAGRLPGKQDSVRGSNKRLPHHAFKEAPACVAP